MLHFFRKIRHDLIANSKFYKYFKYALGEIVLVVIGILIALQINNWNEERKNSELFNARLVEIEKELIFNINNAKDIIEFLHPYDSITTIILLDGLKKEYFESDSAYMYRGIPNYCTFKLQDHAFKKLLEIENGLTSKQDSLYQNLVLLYAQDSIYATSEVEKNQLNLYNKVTDSYEEHEWFLNLLLGKPYSKEEISYYLNNSTHKINVAKYANTTLGFFNSNIQSWEKRLLKNYKTIYNYLDELNIQHSDSLLFEYDAAQYKHYMGVFKPFESDGIKIQKKPSEIVKIELIENKYIWSLYFQGERIVSSEIIPISQYYFRLKKIGITGYYNLVFDDNNKVSGMTFSTGNIRVKLKKIK